MIDNLAKLVVDNGGTISPLIIPGELTDGTGLCNVSVFIDDNDDIITNIYESSGGTLMKESMMGVHMRKGDYGKALEIDPIFGSTMMEQLEQDYIGMTEDIMNDAGAHIGASKQKRGFWTDTLTLGMLDLVDGAQDLTAILRNTFGKDMPEDVKTDMEKRLAERDQDFVDLFNDSGFTDKQGNEINRKNFTTFITDMDGKIDFSKLQDIAQDRDHMNHKAAERILAALYTDPTVMKRINAYSGDTSFEDSGKWITVQNGNKASYEDLSGNIVPGIANKPITSTDMVGFRQSIVGAVESYKRPMAASFINTSFLENPDFLKMFDKELTSDGKHIVQIDNDEFMELFGRYRKDDPRANDPSLYPPVAPGMLDTLFGKLELSAKLGLLLTLPHIFINSNCCLIATFSFEVLQSVPKYFL